MGSAQPTGCVQPGSGDLIHHYKNLIVFFSMAPAMLFLCLNQYDRSAPTHPFYGKIFIRDDHIDNFMPVEAMINHHIDRGGRISAEYNGRESLDVAS